MKGVTMTVSLESVNFGAVIEMGDSLFIKVDDGSVLASSHEPMKFPDSLMLAMRNGVIVVTNKETQVRIVADNWASAFVRSLT